MPRRLRLHVPVPRDPLPARLLRAVAWRPLSDEDPHIAPALVPLRETLMAMTGRPVNIQASRDVVMQVRGDMLGQPYLVLIDTVEDPAA